MSEVPCALQSLLISWDWQMDTNDITYKTDNFWGIYETNNGVNSSTLLFSFGKSTSDRTAEQYNVDYTTFYLLRQWELVIKRVLEWTDKMVIGENRVI